MPEPVVTIDQVSSSIVQITLQDREHKNTFSHNLIKQLKDAYRQIGDSHQYKVVILTGYDTYFCSGGTRDSLLAIYNKEAKFTDADGLYSLALDCEIPVIAAMQGHGIGGGFVMGLFADWVVLSRESVYTANFMKYGFTPGMGATYILPKKLGIPLAHEMLLNGGSYRGADLEQRGVPLAVMSRREVLDHAYRLAEELAEKPRVSLITLKNHLVAGMRKELAGFIAEEVKMHEQTFHQDQVQQSIMSRFGQ